MLLTAMQWGLSKTAWQWAGLIIVAPWLLLEELESTKGKVRRKNFKMPTCITEETQWLATFALERNPRLRSLFNGRNYLFKSAWSWLNTLKIVRYVSCLPRRWVILGVWPNSLNLLPQVDCKHHSTNFIHLWEVHEDIQRRRLAQRILAQILKFLCTSKEYLAKYV